MLPLSALLFERCMPLVKGTLEEGVLLAYDMSVTNLLPSLLNP